MTGPAATAGSRYDVTPVRWGQGSQMTSLEAAMWRADDRALLRSSTVVVEVLDVTPAWERVVAGHQWALGLVPRLRQRVVEDPLHLGPPAWLDTQVDIDRHLRRVRLPAGGTLDDALEVARDLHERPFDPGRPLWEAALVEGLPGRRAAYVLKLHHAMGDGQAIVALFDLIHSDVRKPTLGVPSLPVAPHEDRTALSLTAEHALRAVHGAPTSVLQSVQAGVRTARHAVRDPGRAVRTGAQAVRTVGASLGTGAGTPSSLLDGRGLGRSLDAIDVPAAQLRAAGEAAGVSLGDVALAAVVDGLSRYHRELGVPVDELPIAVPMPLRPGSAQDNRFARARIGVPAGDLSPATRARVVRRRVEQADARPEVDVLRVLAAAVSRAPGPLIERVAQRSTRPLALQAFTVRGLDRDAYLAGAKVVQMFSFGPTTGCAMAVMLTTHQDTCCMGFTYDTAAITDLALMRCCMREAFAAAVAPAPAPARDTRTAA